PVGSHCILEMYGIDPALLDDVSFVRVALADASREGMSTLIQMTSHRFEPQGVTALALLAESHISIHTWPERGYAAVDIFMCGDAEPARAVPVLRAAFRPGRVAVSEQKRGML
ncbi:MAG: adenosylmethionine decarboxylase, partial [Pseudomonadota bacterium]